MFDPEPLGEKEKGEIDRFRWALELEKGFAFHLIVADTRDVFEAALGRLPESLAILRPRPPKDLSARQAAAQILTELDRAIEAPQDGPVLLDAMIAHQEPAWAIVFRRLNELRNGLEHRHSAPLVLAVSPAGEGFFGREAPDLWSRRGSGMRLHDHRPRRPAGAVPKGLLPPPSEPAAFESLCLDLFREIWNDPGAQKYGRSGQRQAGVDIFGRAAGRSIGVQCRLRAKLTLAELNREVENARAFVPRLHTFILATIGPRDAEIQARARQMTTVGALEVQVWAWDDIWQELRQRRELLANILPDYWPDDWPQPRVSSSRVPGTEKLFGRKGEMARLDEAWRDSRTHIVTLVGMGGAGKTSLVAKWAASLAVRDYDGADYFDWSFYSQGMRETGGPSSDTFLAAALEFFGDAELAGSPASAWDKGARLAELVARRRTLLVLDGLEPLQHPPGPLKGQLKDPALTAGTL